MSELATFDRFLEAVRGTNPFRSTRITDPARSDGDVSQIHQRAFEKLRKAVEIVGKEPIATGVLLLGAAGVGKSHLLARLFQWAEEDHATVVYLHNILASPERMFRYVLNATISNLVSHRGAYAESRLYQVLTRALLREGGPRRGDLVGRREAMARVARRLDPGGSVGPVLAIFLDAASPNTDLVDAEARARAAVLWLSGETLDADDARLLGKVAPDEGLSLPDDAAVDQVLQVLAKVCAQAERPLVLCLDQVDNLDAGGVTALSALAQALLDRAQHLLVVVSGVKETLLRLKHDGVIPQAAWDRIAERTIELTKISADEARAVINGRLEPMIGTFQRRVPEVAAARERDAMFPIGTSWFLEKLGDLPEFRPRDVVTWARDRWEQQQALLEDIGGQRWIDTWQSAPPLHVSSNDIDAVIDEEVKKKLMEGINRRKLQPSTLPPDEDNLAILVNGLLTHCVGDQRYTLTDLKRTKLGRKAVTYHLLATERRADGLSVTTGVTFLTAPSGHGTRWALSRMLGDTSPPTHRILVTDEERRPLRLGKEGREQYEKLDGLGNQEFLHVKLSFEAYADLDSMVGLLGDARSGDLEVEYPKGTPRAVTETEALASLHRNGRFLAHPLLRELLTEDLDPISEVAGKAKGFDENRARQHIAAELSWRLGLMARELAQTFSIREKLTAEPLDDVWARIKETARKLHDEGHVYAAAQDDDLFLQFRKKSV
jgi:hypothetical protein